MEDDTEQRNVENIWTQGRGVIAEKGKRPNEKLHNL